MLTLTLMSQSIKNSTPFVFCTPNRELFIFSASWFQSPQMIQFSYTTRLIYVDYPDNSSLEAAAWFLHSLPYNSCKSLQTSLNLIHQPNISVTLYAFLWCF